MPQNATLTARQLITSQQPAPRLGVNCLLLPCHCCLHNCFQLPPHSSITSWLPVTQWMCTDLQPQLLLCCSLFPIWQGYSVMVTCRYRKICLHFTKRERQRKKMPSSFCKKNEYSGGGALYHGTASDFHQLFPSLPPDVSLWGVPKGLPGHRDVCWPVLEMEGDTLKEGAVQQPLLSCYTCSAGE